MNYCAGFAASKLAAPLSRQFRITLLIFVLPIYNLSLNILCGGCL